LKLTLPELSFVVLIGVSGTGKSTVARKHFKPTGSPSLAFLPALVSRQVSLGCLSFDGGAKLEAPIFQNPSAEYGRWKVDLV